MGKNVQSLGELELEVLKTVWAGDGCTVQQAVEIIGSRRKCARTTILTVMQRLHAKGFVKRRKIDGVFRYYSTEGQGKVMSRLVRQFVEKVLDGSPTPLISYLAESGVDRQELAEIQKVLDKAHASKEAQS